MRRRPLLLRCWPWRSPATGAASGRPGAARAPATSTVVARIDGQAITLAGPAAAAGAAAAVRAGPLRLARTPQGAAGEPDPLRGAGARGASAGLRPGSRGGPPPAAAADGPDDRRGAGRQAEAARTSPRRSCGGSTRSNPERFTQPEAVRVSQILVSDAETAARVAAAARALGPRDDRGFRAAGGGALAGRGLEAARRRPDLPRTPAGGGDADGRCRAGDRGRVRADARWARSPARSRAIRGSTCCV